eukprot:TRINITY_DN17231_c0_g1_i1.p1 TRINITY_DN17231_c0_g1~~TRINITY_DN17231_c0_g1_i1.p1  ORF type:complete len:109 (+),score=6.32 TRINITY_DN17231_c0_g1_i1:16-342(+)
MKGSKQEGWYKRGEGASRKTVQTERNNGSDKRIATSMGWPLVDRGMRKGDEKGGSGSEQSDILVFLPVGKMPELVILVAERYLEEKREEEGGSQESGQGGCYCLPLHR